MFCSRGRSCTLSPESEAQLMTGLSSFNTNLTRETKMGFLSELNKWLYKWVIALSLNIWIIHRKHSICVYVAYSGCTPPRQIWSFTLHNTENGKRSLLKNIIAFELPLYDEHANFSKNHLSLQSRLGGCKSCKQWFAFVLKSIKQEQKSEIK